MNNNLGLTFSDFYTYGLIGAILAIVYLVLLYQTISILKQVKHKNLILFISAALRIFLLIFVALVCAEQNLSLFLIIVSGFLLTRALLLKLLKPTYKKKVTKSEIILYADRKKQEPLPLKRTKRRRR